MESIQVVALDRSHFQGMRACLDAVAREERYLAFTEAPPEESTRLYLEDMLARHCPHILAMDGDAVVGWIDINIHTLPGFSHSGRLGMGLLAAYRGKGIGTRLLRAAVDAARSLGLKRIELEVFASNTAAIRLYEREGFVVEGTKRRARILHGSADDIIQMALFLP